MQKTSYIHAKDTIENLFKCLKVPSFFYEDVPKHQFLHSSSSHSQQSSHSRQPSLFPSSLSVCLSEDISSPSRSSHNLSHNTPSRFTSSTHSVVPSSSQATPVSTPRCTNPLQNWKRSKPGGGGAKVLFPQEHDSEKFADGDENVDNLEDAEFVMDAEESIQEVMEETVTVVEISEGKEMEEGPSAGGDTRTVRQVLQSHS